MNKKKEEALLSLLRVMDARDIDDLCEIASALVVIHDEDRDIILKIIRGLVEDLKVTSTKLKLVASNPTPSKPVLLG